MVKTTVFFTNNKKFQSCQAYDVNKEINKYLIVSSHSKQKKKILP